MQKGSNCPRVTPERENPGPDFQPRDFSQGSWGDRKTWGDRSQAGGRGMTQAVGSSGRWELPGGDSWPHEARWGDGPCGAWRHEAWGARARQAPCGALWPWWLHGRAGHHGPPWAQRKAHWELRKNFKWAIAWRYYTLPGWQPHSGDQPGRMRMGPLGSEDINKINNPDRSTPFHSPQHIPRRSQEHPSSPAASWGKSDTPRLLRIIRKGKWKKTM